MRKVSRLVLSICFVGLFLCGVIGYQQWRIYSLKHALAVNVNKLMQHVDEHTRELKEMAAAVAGGRSYAYVKDSSEQTIQPTVPFALHLATVEESAQPVAIFGDLPEPETLSESSDVFARIDMLRAHLNSNPSITWVDDVLKAAARDLMDAERKLSGQEIETTFKKFCPRYGR